MSAKPGSRTRARELMMARLDGELESEARGELDRLLAEQPELEREWQRLNRVKNMTSAVALRTPPDEIWEGYMSSVYRRVERGVGWILASLGAIVLFSYGMWTGVKQLIGQSEIAWYLKAATIALLVGLAIIIVSVVREKLFVRSIDPYREIER